MYDIIVAYLTNEKIILISGINISSLEEKQTYEEMLNRLNSDEGFQSANPHSQDCIFGSKQNGTYFNPAQNCTCRNEC